MKIGEQKIIDDLEYKVQMGRALLDLLPTDDENQTRENKDAIAFVKQEIQICETLVFCIKTGS